MQTEHLIPAGKFCTSYNIGFSFIRNLQELGLLEITTIKEISYIPEKQLEKLERILRLHSDLKINIEGIDIITHLLVRIKKMQAEIMGLKNKLRLYEDSEQANSLHG